MRILHVVPTYAPAWRYGGPIHAVHALCRSLAEIGHEVSVFTTSVDGPGDLDVPVGIPVERDGVRVSYFRSRVARRTYWSPPLGRVLRQRIDEFDVVHAHSVFLWPTWRAARTASSRGKPFVISPRGMLVPELIAAKSPWLKRAWIALVERGNLASAAAIHVTSETEACDLRRAGLDLAPVAVVPNGVDPQGIGGRARDPATVAYLGRISWKKGLDRLIAALVEVPEVTLVVAGNDEEGLRPALERQCVELGVARRVRFVGHLSGADKQALLDSATLLVLPSLSENFGNAVVEAMAHGCPVVVSDGVGAAEIVAECSGGVVCDGTPASIAASIREIVGHPDVAARMGENARRHVSTHLDWKRIAVRMTDVYADAIARRRA